MYVQAGKSEESEGRKGRKENREINLFVGN